MLLEQLWSTRNDVLVTPEIRRPAYMEDAPILAVDQTRPSPRNATLHGVDLAISAVEES